MTTIASQRVRSPRLITFRALAVMYALVVALAMFGLPSLLSAWTISGAELPLRTSYVLYGALAGIVIPGICLATLWRPSLAVARALLAVVVAVVVATAVGFNSLHLVYASAIAFPALLLLVLHPRGREVLTRSDVDVPAMVVAGLMAIPGVWYGVRMAIESRTTAWVDDAHEYTVHGQYSQAAVLAFTLVLLGVIGALRTRGRRTIALVTAAAALLAGIAGVAFPDDLMSPGTAGGAALIAAALAFGGLALRRDAERGSR